MQLGVDPQNCVVVEDAAAGVQAARLAGEVSSLCECQQLEVRNVPQGQVCQTPYPGKKTLASKACIPGSSDSCMQFHAGSGIRF